jgi:hypothetical protein
MVGSLFPRGGKVIGDCIPQHRQQEFIRFLKRIDQDTPKEFEVHLIVDNYATHKHPRVKTLVGPQSTFSPALHTHFLVLAQLG